VHWRSLWALCSWLWVREAHEHCVHDYGSPSSIDFLCLFHCMIYPHPSQHPNIWPPFLTTILGPFHRLSPNFVNNHLVSNFFAMTIPSLDTILWDMILICSCTGISIDYNHALARHRTVVLPTLESVLISSLPSHTQSSISSLGSHTALSTTHSPLSSLLSSGSSAHPLSPYLQKPLAIKTVWAYLPR